MFFKKYRFYCLVFFIYVSVTCFKKPQWEVPITIPLLSKTYSITSLLDTNDFNIGIDSLIYFNLTGKSDTIFLLDLIHLQNLSDTNNSTLKDFLIRNIDTTTACINAEEITGQQLPDTTIYINVDTISILVNRTLHLTNIRTLSVASCVVHLNIINGTRIFCDSVVCQLNNFEPITIYSIDSLSSTNTHHRYENIDIDSIVSLSILLISSGTGADSILASTQDSVTFIVTFDSLRINSGSFRSCPPRVVKKSKERIYSLPSNYSIRINDLSFQSGDLLVNLDNQFPFLCSLQVTIPELSFDTLVLLPAFDSTYCSLSLANRTYHNTSDSLTPITLQTMFTILLDSFFIDIGQENSIKVRYHISDIEIDSLAGTIIDTIRQEFSADTIFINIPDFLNNVETVNAVAMLDISNAITFPLYLNFHIASYNDIGNSAAIDTFFPIPAGSPTLPQNTVLTLDFNHLFNIHPTFAVINASVSSVGDGWMNRASFTTAAYTITSPLRIILHLDTISFDPETISISSRIRNTIRDYTDSSNFYAHIQNHIPAPLSGKIILQNLLSVPIQTVDIGINIPSGIVDNSGIVTMPLDTNIIFTLDDQQTKIFTDSLIQFALVLYVPETDTINITARDYFRVVNSYARIQTKTSRARSP